MDSSIVNFYSQLNDKKNEAGFSKHSNIESIGLININTAQESRFKSLPGIGEYTAKAILGIAYNKPVMPIDSLIALLME